MSHTNIYKSFFGTVHFLDRLIVPHLHTTLALLYNIYFCHSYCVFVEKNHIGRLAYRLQLFFLTKRSFGAAEQLCLRAPLIEL